MCKEYLFAKMEKSEAQNLKYVGVRVQDRALKLCPERNTLCHVSCIHGYSVELPKRFCLLYPLSPFLKLKLPDD